MKAQRGMALVVSLVLLIMVMLLSVSAVQWSLQGEKAARAERDRDVAFQSAEDAVTDAERDIQGSGSPVRQAAFDGGDPKAFAAECGAGGAGLRVRAEAGKAPVWQKVDLSGAEDGGACTVTHGTFTGASMQTGEGFLPFKKPRYVIERMECHQPGDDASAGAAPHYCYRVTVIGFGAQRETEVVLQSVFSKPE
ncbi:pilus assembly PilX family protein [Duganella callida]|uniref:Pilus assembly protein PilX n=1 Tax=Duganella callida TaxID=2561932 RepID=A0A4Y9SDQ9_9BURK|nr:PilX N-terminal domain-containing pilus assembly protein [Duganella callida]TFW20894.1 pilus assembly protein PilX [Duganella callida]